MGGGSKTTHQTTQVNKENPYDDAWIRNKFQGIDERGLEYSNFMAGRQANLAGEAAIRNQLQSGLSGLQSDFRGAQADLRNTQGNLGSLRTDLGGLRGDLGGLSSDFRGDLAGLRGDLGGLRSDFTGLSGSQNQIAQDFAGLSGSQLQQAKDLYNLANQKGSGVQGYRNAAGMTFIRPQGTAGLNRSALQTQSLNV